MGLGQAVVQLLHAGAHIRVSTAQAGIIGCVDHGHIPQLIAHGPLHIRHMAVQRFRRDLVGIQLIGQCGQLVKKRRPLRGPPEHSQPGMQLLQAAAHGQQFAAVIQRHIGQSACLGQHTGGQTLKTEHLRTAAGGGAAGAAQVQLRLMGGMLRHQQYLGPLFPAAGNGFQHARRLSAARAAYPDGQHKRSSSR